MKEKETKKLFVLLYIILGLLVINTCFVVFDNGTSTSNNKEEEEEPSEYDVSSFTAIDESEFLDVADKSSIQVVYLGRSSCGYCQKFLPTLKEAQEKLDYTTYYVDITTVDTTSDDYTTMTTMINNMTDKFNETYGYTGDNAYTYLYGYTPMVVLVKDGKIVDIWVGYSTYDTFASWLSSNGIK
ncbi:MAG TPA: thioredoxin family protein [Bacilli bacterium]|nr:thioredoxin family protein [Bacilli bacterium]